MSTKLIILSSSLESFRIIVLIYCRECCVGIVKRESSYNKYYIIHIFIKILNLYSLIKLEYLIKYNSILKKYLIKLKKRKNEYNHIKIFIKDKYNIVKFKSKVINMIKFKFKKIKIINLN